jgi:tryptophan synthase alpha chain
MRSPLASALATAAQGRTTLVVPYLMVDRARRRGLGRRVEALRDGGATALELGFPFSDPIADGRVLEEASRQALEHGTTWEDLMHAARTASAILPTAVMTYANPLYHHGLSRAISELRDAGISGLIVPDLSLEEMAPFRSAARKVGIALVLLAAPATSDFRIRRIARATEGFLYLVAHYGTTGAASAGARVPLAPIISAAHRARSRLPVLVGFGIRGPTEARTALASGADGVVIGSAIEQLVASNAAPAKIESFVRAIAVLPRPGR